MNTVELQELTTDQLHRRASDLGILGTEDLGRDELIEVLTRADAAMTRSEERLVVGTELHEIGRARLRKHVVTEDVQITVTVRREELRLERIPIDDSGRRVVEDPDVFGTLEEFGGEDGGVIFDVTLHEERPVITTEIVPVERVRLMKVVQTDQVTVSGEVRKERIEVDVPGEAPATLD